MKYLFIPSEQNKFKGILYELKGMKKVVVSKAFNLEKSKDIQLIAAVICQFIAEGYALTDLVEDNKFLPSKSMFYHWTKEDEDIFDWYEEAKQLRNVTVIEDLYSKIRAADDLDEKSINRILTSLKQIQDSIDNKLKDRAPKVVLKNTIWTPSILEAKYGKN